MNDLRILLTNGQEVNYTGVSGSERAALVKALDERKAIQIMSEGRYMVLNPAHVVAITDLRAGEASEQVTTDIPAQPHPRDAPGRCKACRGRGSFVRIRGRVKEEMQCERCGGTGKEPETGGVGWPE